MKSIRVKLWAGMMSLVAIVLILLWLFQIVFLKSFYTNIRISEVKNEGKDIVKLFEEGNKTEFTNKLEAFAFKNNLSVELLDSKGNSTYTAGATGNMGQMPMMKNSSRIEAYESTLAGKETLTSLTHPHFGNKFMLIGLPIKISGEFQGALIINMPLAPVEDTTSILKKQLIYVTFILIVAALIISFLISKSFTKPILQIKKAAETMASGDFSISIEERKEDELGDLAKTINYLGQQLSKIEELRKDLIANVSHELRTPLSIIRGYAETIRDVTGAVPEKREKQLGIIIEESERLSRIVDDILDLSRLQSGNFTLNKSKFKLEKLLDDVVRRYDVLSESNGIEIVQEYSGESLIEGDEGRIEQVLYNLINNAFNHTEEGGSVKVKVIEKKDSVRIQISDTGTGIEEEDIPHIWDRYYKAKKTGDKKTLGTGLGLAIVKNLLEAHKAEYGVDSKIGEGTTFWFELKNS